MVVLGRTGDVLFPMSAVVAFMVRRGNAPVPLLVYPDCSPLTKTKFVEIVRSTVGKLGLLKDSFSGHSFRIRAATAAAPGGSKGFHNYDIG